MVGFLVLRVGDGADDGAVFRLRGCAGLCGASFEQDPGGPGKIAGGLVLEGWF